MISNAHLPVCDAGALTTRPVGVNPGGSGRDDLGFGVGFELRSMTHCGGGGGSIAALDAIVSVYGGLGIGRDGGEVVVGMPPELGGLFERAATPLLSTTPNPTIHEQFQSRASCPL